MFDLNPLFLLFVFWTWEAGFSLTEKSCMNLTVSEKVEPWWFVLLVALVL